MTKISFKCSECQSSEFQIPDDNEADQTIYCNQCKRAVGQKSEVIEALRKEGEKVAKSQMDDLVKGLGKGGWKIK